MQFPTCFAELSDLYFPKECLLELGLGIKQRVEQGKFGGEDLCDPLEM